MNPQDSDSAVKQAQGIIALHSKSFSLASRVLPEQVRDAAAVVYSWCRRVDDAVDLASTPSDALRALDGERERLSLIYRGVTPEEPLLAAFQSVVQRKRIPLQLPLELLEGMQMDVNGQQYETLEELQTYCFRVAGTVGLMMSHVMGLRHPEALRQATHLGIAMQLTNICRDVLEDWNRGRLYLPNQLLREAGLEGLGRSLGIPLDETHARPLAKTVKRLLHVAGAYYRSGDSGVSALSWRCAWAVRAARDVYSSIGDVLEARGFDVCAGRAVVSLPRKLVLVGSALVRTLAEASTRPSEPFMPCVLPEKVVVDELIRL